MWRYSVNCRFNTNKPLLEQLTKLDLELDQKLRRALEVSASKPNIAPEDVGFPDSYLTLALYRLNPILTRVVELDESRYNIFHNYKLAPPCRPEEIVPGVKLCGVLDKAANLAEPKKTIGVGDFLRAVVSLTLDEEPEPAYGFPNKVIHNTFSAETLLWGLGYTAWTRLSDAPEVKHILKALDGREPVEDFQYLMTFESNKIIFRPTSVLDTYRMQATRGGESTRLALLTHFQDHYAGVMPSEILELEDLVNNPRAKEKDLQQFFETHPHFFRMWDYRDIYPHVYLTREDEGPLIPDFILVDPELQKAMVLELKLPRVKLVTHKLNRERFSAAIDEARSQLFEYKDWFEDSHNRAKLIEKVGMEIYRPRMGVIIGTSQDFRDTVQRQKIASRYPEIEVVTYDDIIKYAQRRLLLVKGAMRNS
jgi:hypothetical protein